MKWSEIKQAIEQAGIDEDDEILEIHCEPRGGDKTLHPVRLGSLLRMVENLTIEEQKKETVGCAA